MTSTFVTAPLLLPYETKVASKPISAFISLETGHHAFAFDAIDWNVVWSMPGIFAETVRWTEVIEKPSLSGSITTSDLLFTCSGTKPAIPSTLTNDIVKHAAALGETPHVRAMPKAQIACITAIFSRSCSARLFEIYAPRWSNDVVFSLAPNMILR